MVCEVYIYWGFKGLVRNWGCNMYIIGIAIKYRHNMICYFA